MARSHRRRNRFAEPRRQLPVANRRLASALTDVLRRFEWPMVEDRRRFEPDPRLKPARTHRGVPGRLRMVERRSPLHDRPTGRLAQILERPAFVSPKSVMVCKRRKERREVLHALKRLKSGRGGSKRRNQWSDVKC